MKKVLVVLSVLTLVFLMISCTPNNVLFAPQVDFALKSLGAGGNQFPAGVDLPVNWSISTNVKDATFEFVVDLKKDDGTVILNEKTTNKDGYTIDKSKLVAGNTYKLKVTANDKKDKIIVESKVFTFTVVSSQITFETTEKIFGGPSYLAQYLGLNVPFKSNDGLAHVYEWALDVAANWNETASATEVTLTENNFENFPITSNGRKITDGVHVLYVRIKGNGLIHTFPFIFDTKGPSVTMFGSQRENNGYNVYGGSTPSGKVALLTYKVTDYTNPIINIGLMDYTNGFDNDARIVLPGKTNSKGYFGIKVPENISGTFVFKMLISNDTFKIMDLSGNELKLIALDDHYIPTGVEFNASDFNNFKLDHSYRVFMIADDGIYNETIDIKYFKLQERFADDKEPQIYLETDSATVDVNNPTFKVRVVTKNLKDYLSTDEHSVIEQDVYKSNGLNYLQIPFTFDSTATISGLTVNEFNSDYELGGTATVDATNNIFVYAEGFTSNSALNNSTGSATDVLAEFTVTLTGAATGTHNIKIPYESYLKLIDKDGKTIDGVKIDYKGVNVIVEKASSSSKK
ncbi:hypothetical protein OSSY52_10760 [Tepiditoga spiralis]|uniref:Uncharacterized protein n=1 Tax=Tepiditoga spiralis TaxID=2108365 RepID=A0A7G1G4C0_9BACT|nr:hypothetical protein [Tepiditoga spiralis]BBE30935.1 hypothetical protein OSSY52_10760 [Tepiditoga spiralis]